MKMVMRLAATLLALATAAPAFAEQWAGVDATRRPKIMGAGDIDFVVSELCFPYLFNDAAVEAIVDRPLVVRMPRPPGFAPQGAWMAGKAGTVVGFAERNGARNCTISIDDGDPDALRAALQKRLDQVPGGLTPGAQPPPPVTYARREFLCNAPQGPHYTAVISTRSLDRRGPKMMVTLSRAPERNARCDAPVAPAPVTPPATTL